MATRKERVLAMLEEARDTGSVTIVTGTDRYENENRATYQTDDGWVSGNLLCHPSVGGSEGLRRLRELRDDGHAIEKRPRPHGASSFEYRLVDAPPVDLFAATEEGTR